MCNLYKNERRKLSPAMAELFGFDYEEFSETRIKIDFPELPETIYPDYLGLVARMNENGKVVADAMRWGFPPLPQKPGERKPSLITNVRNTKSGYWRPWLRPEYRCVVLATAFSEWSVADKRPAWFELTGGEVFGFAGIWRPWNGERGLKKSPIVGDHKLYSFLTTDPNAVVAPIHSKAMPVLLHPGDFDTWLTGPVEEALELQKPMPDDALKLIAA